MEKGTCNMDNEKMFDEFFGIITGDETVYGLEPDEEGDCPEMCQEKNLYGDDNPYQATFYDDLITIFNQVDMEPDDRLVDFGCGLGRVLFYVNSRHYCKVTGIENNKKIYDRLLINAAGYQSRFLEQESRMSFYCQRADEYEIKPEENFFYFFNPFSGVVFGRVIDNILESVRRTPRDVRLIIYYPTYEILKEMRRAKLFVQTSMIKLSHYEEDPNEKAYVYYLSRYVVT